MQVLKTSNKKDYKSSKQRFVRVEKMRRVQDREAMNLIREYH